MGDEFVMDVSKRVELANGQHLFSWLRSISSIPVMANQESLELILKQICSFCVDPHYISGNAHSDFV